MRDHLSFLAALPLFIAMKFLLALDSWLDGEPWDWENAGELFKRPRR